MRVFELYTANTLEMIAEANVMNVKDEYQGISIAKFLNNYVDSFSSKEAKQMWLKKLAKLFINDERFLNAVREVPNDAPEWAQKAAAAGELFYFQPTPELKDKMDNLSHYVAGLEGDMKGQDNDAKAFATREFQGFVKAENIDTLITKADEYFKRGSKKASKGDTTGLKQVLESGGGYTWWLLQDQAAYRREGKVLQNCIGTHWTKQKADSQGYSIVVLKNPNMESVVASRIHKTDNEMYEMKGKNNKAPIPKYMPHVQTLINKFKLDASSASYDIKNAGYFYANNKLYTKAQAVQELINAKSIGKLSDKLDLVQVESPNYELMNDLYQTGVSQYSEDRKHPEKWPKIYEARTSDKTPTISAVVSPQGELKKIHRYVTPTINQGTMAEAVKAANISVKDNATRDFLSALMRMNLIKSVTPNLQREMFWNDKMHYNKDKGEFEDTSPSEEVTTDKKHHKWSVYTGASVKDFASSLRRQSRYRSNEEKAEKEDKFLDQVERVYTTTASKATGESQKETDKIYAIAVTKDNKIAPYTIRGNQVKRGNTTSKSDGSLDEKTLNSIIGLANEKGFDVPRTVQIRQGIGKDKNGKYSREVLKVEPTAMGGKFPGKKWDFTGIPLENRLAAVVRTVTQDIRSNNNSWRGARDEFGILEGLKKLTSGDQYGDWEEADFYWGDKDTKNYLSEYFSGFVPDGLVSVPVKFGHEQAHIINMLLHGKDIIAIDDESKKHNWQKWDDYETVTKQLNDFAKEHGLKFHKKAANKSKEFSVGSDGEIMPMEAAKKQQIEKLRASGRYGKEGVDEIPFSNGMKIKRMDPEQQGQWLRRGIEKKTAGEAWYLETEEGQTPAAFFVSNGKVTQMYYKPQAGSPEARKGIPRTERQRELAGGRADIKQNITLPTASGVDKRYLPFIKSAAEKFGWTWGPSLQFGKKSRYAKTLAQYIDGGQRYRYAIKPIERALINLGLLQAEGRGQRKTITPTAKGREVAQHIEDGTSVDIADLVSSVEIDPKFKVPEKPAPAARPAGGPRAPRAPMAGGGTKSQRALTRFTEMTNENGQMPTRSEFIRVLQAEPFNMSAAGAQTYFYNTKKKALRANEEVAESVTARGPISLAELFLVQLRS